MTNPTLRPMDDFPWDHNEDDTVVYHSGFNHKSGTPHVEQAVCKLAAHDPKAVGWLWKHEAMPANQQPLGDGTCTQCRQKAEERETPIGAWWFCPRCFRSFGCTAKSRMSGART